MTPWLTTLFPDIAIFQETYLGPQQELGRTALRGLCRAARQGTGTLPAPCRSPARLTAAARLLPSCPAAPGIRGMPRFRPADIKRYPTPAAAPGTLVRGWQQQRLPWPTCGCPFPQHRLRASSTQTPGHPATALAGGLHTACTGLLSTGSASERAQGTRPSAGSAAG